MRRSLLTLLLAPLLTLPAAAQQRVTIDAAAPTQPLPHFWETIFGSGRANLMLRAQWQQDLDAVRSVTALQYVRGHGILDDENGVYTEDEHGNPVYNFAYVDQIYDALLARHVRPMVELSFMPKRLAFNPDALHPFWYKPNVSPPKSWERWDALIAALARHLVARYGVDEVSQWYFEVWNEPNIDFWNGIPRQESYFELYDHTARALKAVSPRLRVGGPATAAADWVDAFLAFVAAHHTPIDFVSSHGYADDTIANLFPAGHTFPVPVPPASTPYDQRVCLAIGKVHTQIAASPLPRLPLFWTEWNVQGNGQSRDTPFVGPALADTIRQCAGLVDQMSFWTFSDVFEEGGPISTPFQGNFGLRAAFGINKPSFYDFALLHQLGDRLLPTAATNLLVTKDASGALVLAAWNLVDPAPENSSQPGRPDPALTAPTRTLTLTFQNLPAEAPVTLSQVDSTHGNPLPLYKKLGAPVTPTAAQVEQLNRATTLPVPTQTHLTNHTLTVTLPPNALALIHVTP